MGAVGSARALPTRGLYTPPLLEVRNLSVEFATSTGTVRAVDDVSFKVGPGERLAILGESGSGKTTAALAIVGLLPTHSARVVAGQILLGGRDLVKARASEIRRIRGDRIAIVFQDSLSSLNPVLPVGSQIGEALRHRRGMSRGEAREAVVALMERVEIPGARLRVDDYPHQFSGGMRQRVMIALALTLEPELLIADEPTTALDVTVQAQIMRLLVRLCEDDRMGLILITHDIGVVATSARRVLIMYAGRLVEMGEIPETLVSPAHPYTLGLLRSTPTGSRESGRIVPIRGQPADLRLLPSGCNFHPRCELSRERSRCSDEEPALRDIGRGSLVSCHFAEELVS